MIKLKRRFSTTKQLLDDSDAMARDELIPTLVRTCLAFICVHSFAKQSYC